MLNFSTAKFRFDPYPIGIATNVFAQKDYETLLRAYPDEAIFKQLTGAYNKWSLSERNNFEAYKAFIKGNPEWIAFFAYTKSLKLPQDLFACLKQAGVMTLLPPSVLSGKSCRTRFEFSSLPSDGGGIEPHTDIPSKVLTLILPMVRPGEWDPTWGGGTDVLRPLDPWRRHTDYKEPRKNFERVETFAYQPNQCVIFIKTFNSWHSVGPIMGPPGRWRRSLTINVELVA